MTIKNAGSLFLMQVFYGLTDILSTFFHWQYYCHA